MSERIVLAKINGKIDIFNYDKSWDDKVIPFITLTIDCLEDLKQKIEYLQASKDEVLDLHKRITLRP